MFGMFLFRRPGSAFGGIRDPYIIFFIATEFEFSLVDFSSINKKRFPERKARDLYLSLAGWMGHLLLEGCRADPRASALPASLDNLFSCRFSIAQKEKAIPRQKNLKIRLSSVIPIIRHPRPVSRYGGLDDPPSLAILKLQMASALPARG
ncbi:MAG TPA: hypothetical protein VNG29_01700 [Candidatus Paceibacterota bacterium]|nr:hypothetical protein [Candidatus Paceibacterota bacterium]